MLTIEQAFVLDRIDRDHTYTEIRKKDKEVCPGLHFCPEWDYLPICDDSPEKEACLCNE